jgi:hypothetical protein
LAELRDIVDRADGGDPKAKREFERELAKLSVSLETDGFE